MKVLSLFDGISCARVALERAGIPVEQYFASEVDKYAIQVSQKNWPDILQLGSVVGLDYDAGQFCRKNDKGESHTMGIDFHTDIDLLIGGSPCQDLSIAKRNRKGLDGERSGLFWEYVRILNETKPKWFILENVASMRPEDRDLISKTLGVEPIMINASLVSAQNRKRLFWTNIPNVTQPEDRGIVLKDILESGEADRLKSYCIDANYWKGANWEQYKNKGRRQLIKVGSIGKDSMGSRVYSPNGISKTLSANGGGWGAKTDLYLIQTPRGKNKGGPRALDGKTPTLSSSSWQENNKLTDGTMVRKLTPIECERLQGLPDNYTEGVSNTQRYKCLGNAFNVDVVAHILSFIPKQ